MTRHHRLRALIVEDSRADTQLLLHELGQAGFELDFVRVETEADYRAQLELAPDIIFCDYNLPQFHALHALAILRQMELDIPLIIVSGSIGEETAVRAMQEGATDYLLKDRLARLGLAVRQALERRQFRQAERQSEQALRRSEQRYRSLVDNARDGIVALSPDGLITSMNPALETITGWERDHWLGQHFREIVHPDDLQSAREIFARFVQGEMVPVFEIRLRRKDSAPVVVEVTATPQRENEQVVSVVGVVRDITERKRAEQALRESEERYRSLAETSSDAIFVNKGGRIVYANPALLRMLRCDRPEQLLGKSPFDIIHPDYHAVVRERIRTVFEARQPVPFVEEKYVRLDGTVVDVEIAAAPFEDQGEFAAHVTARDLTERKNAERALRESEERFRQITDNCREVLWMSGASPDELLYISPAFEVVSGWSCQALRERPRSWLELVHPNDRDSVRAVLEKPRQGQAISHEFRIIRPDGSVRWVRNKVAPIRDDSGRVGRVAGVLEDITEPRLLQEQLRQVQKMEAIGRLAGGVAHDFNNLLTIINGYSELLLAKLQAGDPLRGMVEQIKKSGDRAAGLTRQLLAFSRKQVLVPESLILNGLVAEMEKMLHRLIGEDIELRVSLQPELWRVKADPAQVEQIIMNLVVNSRDAMPRGGKLTIETSNVELDETYHKAHPYAQPGEYVRLAVSDSGCGMDAATKAKIFEPFFTTKGPEKGTGLGLATVYGIVKQSGGHIEVYSEAGVGSTFKVYLPRDRQGQPLRKSDPARVSRLRGHETVLLVEDEENVRQLARTILEEKGYQVLEAASGGEALLLCEQFQGTIHLMITDVVMPNMSGRQLAERLSTVRPNMKVLYLSGYTDSTIVHHGVLDADMPFLQKPYSPEALARKVREVLEQTAEG